MYHQRNSVVLRKDSSIVLLSWFPIRLLSFMAQLLLRGSLRFESKSQDLYAFALDPAEETPKADPP